MTEKFQNKYRIASTRLQNWDYRWNAAYFITICTKNKEWYFGNVVNGNMALSDLGIIADIMWHEIKNHAKNVELDAFIVMPNHIHGILVLNDSSNDSLDDLSNDASNIVETGHALSVQQPQQPRTIGQQRFRNQGKNSLSSIVGSYKSAVTRHANRLGLGFAWQLRFYEPIIRSKTELECIQKYISENPLNWKGDKFYE